MLVLYLIPALVLCAISVLTQDWLDKYNHFQGCIHDNRSCRDLRELVLETLPSSRHKQAIQEGIDNLNQLGW